MKISNINTNRTDSAFKGSCASFQKRLAGAFANIEGIGEGTSIACDFLGKAIVVPAVIMLASKEPVEKKEYSALKNPVAAIIQLALEVPVLLLGTKAIEKAANKGVLDKGQNREYNEKFYKDSFVNTLKNAAKENSESTKKADELINSINTKRLSRKTTESVEDFIKTLPEKSKSLAQKAFQNYSTAHKKLYHFQNRLCFAATIILTPLICALENKLHPIVMDKIYKIQSRHIKNKINVIKQGIYAAHGGSANRHISIHAFMNNLGKGKVK